MPEPDCTADGLASPADEMRHACRAGALRAGWALSRAWDRSVRLAVCDVPGVAVRPLGELALLEDAGLAVLMPTDRQAAVLFVSVAGGVLPPWYSRPNGLQRGRLASLAQELGVALLPRRLQARDCAAGAVESMGAALSRGRLGDNASYVRLSLVAEHKTAAAVLAWPLERPEAIFPSAVDTSANRRRHDAPASRVELGRVKLPVTAVLCRKREAVGRIARLAPGSILRFDTPCDAPLELHADGRHLATGQCVEIGRRLGLVITSG